MERNKKVTPVSQRGIGAFLTGPNAAKYSEAKEAKRGRPPKQQDTPQSTNGGDIRPNGGEGVGIASAMLQPQPVDSNNLTPVTQDGHDTLKRKLSDIMELGDSSSSEGEGEGGRNSEDGEAMKTPKPASTMEQLALQQRLQRMREQTDRQRQAVAIDPSAPEPKRAHRALLDDTPTSRVWQKISNAAGLAGGLTEYAALAQLVFVMVPGSVADERRFSAMGYLQDPTRNRLHEHLALCVRMFTQDLYDLRTFPFGDALKKWLANSSRGRYLMNR